MTKARRLALAAVIVYVVSAPLSFVNAQANGTPSTTRSQWDKVFTTAQAERGRIAYGLHCESCHGDDLRGVPQLVRYQGQPARTPPLAGDSFVDGWDGLTLGDLHRRILISMPQRSPGSLTRQTVSDVLAFMLQRGGYPAGETELPSQLNDLATIAFLKLKP